VKQENIRVNELYPHAKNTRHQIKATFYFSYIIKKNVTLVFNFLLTALFLGQRDTWSLA